MYNPLEYVSVNRSELITKHEEAIINYFHEIMEQTLGRHLEKYGCEIDQIEELKNLKLIIQTLSDRSMLQLMTDNTIDCLKKLHKEVNDLKEVLKDKESDLAELLGNISELIKKIISDYEFELMEYGSDGDDDILCEQAANAENIARSEQEAQEDGGASNDGVFGIEDRLRYYITAFIKSIDETFSSTKKYLEGEEIHVNLSPTILKVVDFCTQIESLKTIGILTREIAIYFGKRSIKEVAGTIPDRLIDYCSRNENSAALTKGAYKLFSHYEYQFNLLRWKRYMNKIASDSADRYLYYLLDNSQYLKEIKSEDVTKGILQGKSQRNPNRLFQRGRTLVINGKKIKSGDFFAKTGVSEILGDKVVYYVTKVTSYDLKYRLKFPWEDLSEYNTVNYDDPYEYKLGEGKEAVQIESVYKQMYPRCRYIDPDSLEAAIC